MSHAQQNQQTASNFAHDFSIDGDLRSADALHDGAHDCLNSSFRCFAHQGLLPGYGEPAALTVDEDVGEPDFGARLPIGVYHSV
jgi:hypothetical protein